MNSLDGSNKRKELRYEFGHKSGLGTEMTNQKLDLPWKKSDGNAGNRLISIGGRSSLRGGVGKILKLWLPQGFAGGLKFCACSMANVCARSSKEIPTKCD